MEYKTIIEQLQSIKDGQNLADKDKEALDEAMDIVHDYGLATEQAKRLTEKYETTKAVIQRGNGGFDTWQCPTCHQFIGYGNEHCHWCGQKLGWDIRPKSQPKRRKRK